ncbi:hypothetical protein OHA25_08660 [Nonomuraea sp. NBC_00507]|uniref:hypothetical protein n=1 Tax=Nonomuraea sp. NBC_00507 TaxID=2976002 RepID=UPI002E184135
MTAREILALHAALEARRRELHLCRWQVAVQLQIDPRTLWRMSYGLASPYTRRAAEAWLRRHTSPSPTTHETKQGGNDHDSGGSGDG